MKLCKWGKKDQWLRKFPKFIFQFQQMECYPLLYACQEKNDLSY